ncbi:hypothetical protein [Tahibacter amnicola]|uniref:Anti-sigma factor n=1 Tax=Tahibacter amnicola TaxID=2976241 RepID=A0ABY6BL45_9GAMM|nr:hypothetical protein [Tahibacter amnicola]UXI69755.1 hypothetical protein N4264_09020 [Tahibacter amnicola]
MNDVHVATDERIRSYLAGELTGEALERFELELFQDPALLHAVETERVLRTGLRTIASGSVSPIGAAGPPRRPSIAAWPIAASFMLGALLPSLLLWRLWSSPSTQSVAANVQVMLVDTARSAVAATALRIDPAAPRVVLQFAVTLSAETAQSVRDYVIDLTWPDGTRRRFEGLTARGFGELSLDFAASQLPAGTYSAAISTRGHDGHLAEYTTQTFALAK